MIVQQNSSCTADDLSADIERPSADAQRCSKLHLNAMQNQRKVLLELQHAISTLALHTHVTRTAAASVNSKLRIVTACEVESGKHIKPTNATRRQHTLRAVQHCTQTAAQPAMETKQTSLRKPCTQQPPSCNCTQHAHHLPHSCTTVSHQKYIRTAFTCLLTRMPHTWCVIVACHKHS